MISRRSATIALSLILFALSSAAFADDSLDRARKNGVSFGFANEPPYAYLGPDGKAAGISSDFVVAIFKRIGVNDVRPVLTEWASLIPGLKAGRFDVAVPMFILPARCREVAFSEPLRKTGAAMLVAKGNPKGIHSYEDVAKNQRARVAVMAGAAEQNYARRAGISEDRILAFQDQGALLSAVKSGRADAAALTPGSVQSMAEKGGGDVEGASPFVSPSWAIAYSAPPFRQEDTSLRQAFNAAIKPFLGSEEWKSILTHYGLGTDSLPGNMMTETLCSST